MAFLIIAYRRMGSAGKTLGSNIRPHEPDAYDRLLDQLIAEGYLKTPAYITAFRKVMRQDFLPAGMESEAALNAPLPIGGHQTISQPLTAAFMLELLSPRPGQKVLDVGSGSGWTTALLAEIVGSRGHVYAVERLPELQAFSQRNVVKYRYPNVTMRGGDGSRGLPEFAPFDRIQVAAAARAVPPALLQQLAVGGRMVIPTQAEDLRLIERKSPGEYTTKIFSGFLFVPLVENHET